MINYNKTLIVVALPSETDRHFESIQNQLIYTGIGKVNAAQKTTDAILNFKPDFILNIGTAGSHRFQTHELIQIKSVIQRDMDLSPLGFPKGKTPLDEIPAEIELVTVTDLKMGNCGTGDSFQTFAGDETYDLVDMELYAIAKVAKRYGVPCASWKYVSDGSDHNAHNDWAANLPKAALRLKQEWDKLLANS